MKTKKAIEHITSWLKNYSNQSKTKGFVVGISGGIDSALTSTLCALTGKEVLCLLMPIHQHQNEFDRSHEHVEWLCKNFPNVSYTTVDLSETFDTLSKVVPSEEKYNLTRANTRARIRMTTLYAFAGTHGMLVAGTGNKVEDFGVGFYTKYGDGGVDLSPIADLMKSEVFALAKELNIINAIQTAKPTDGLWADGRTDEDQLGASYDELEWAMKTYATDTENRFSGRQKEVFKIFTDLHLSNQHKMDAIPVCILPENLKEAL
ncbi:MAG: NAD(+) synthase [Flavobacteriales bacterium]|nr:NAD(+) synthase [Flavobacteriales bacterium]